MVNNRADGEPPEDAAGEPRHRQSEQERRSAAKDLAYVHNVTRADWYGLGAESLDEIRLDEPDPSHPRHELIAQLIRSRDEVRQELRKEEERVRGAVRAAVPVSATR